MSAETAGPMTRARAGEIMYLLMVIILKNIVEKGGPISPTKKEEMTKEIHEDLSKINISKEEVTAFVDFVLEDTK